MLYFPQLSSGATGQYPINKRRSQRTIVNHLPDGHVIKFSDPGATFVQWQLSFHDLSDSEIATLQQFFTACEGQLNRFTFLDPAGNLLAWSSDLSQSVWQASTLLQITGGIADPNGGSAAIRITNPSASELTLQQGINAPGWFTYCFSGYVRSQSVATISLSRQAGAAAAS